MGYSGAFRVLGRFLEPYEQMGSLSTVDIATEPAGLRATLELTLSLDELTHTGSRVAEDGRIELTFETPGIDDSNDDLELEATETRFENDGTVTVTIDASFPTESTSATPTVEDETPQGTETRDVPPFRDRELLAEIYETYDTFAEMKDALGMDVTAETVRRYMVDYGIHEPNSYNTSHDEAPAKPIIADGIGLPEDVTVESFIETVRRSNTIYEVKQGIGIERDDAIEMLKQLNLLDLVVGRLATESERELTREDVIERLRAASS